jgi:molybdate transport system substrate-binding protein
VIANVPSKHHSYLDISYPAAVIAGPMEAEAKRFLEFLKGPQARAVFARYGFGFP